MESMIIILSILVIFSQIDILHAACSTACISCGFNTCNQCADGFYHDVPGESCPVCNIAGCRDCSSGKDTCSSCKLGFNLNSNSTACIVMPTRCRRYDTTKDECTQCRYQYDGPKSDKKDCAPCAANCASCFEYGAGFCDTCKRGYRRNDLLECEKCAEDCEYCHLAGAGKCNSCRRGYEYDTSSEKCVKIDCKHNCLCDTANPDRCDTCDTGYTWTLDEKGCLSCPANCVSCSTPLECTACKEGKRLHDKMCVNSAAYIRYSFFMAVLCLFTMLYNL